MFSDTHYLPDKMIERSENEDWYTPTPGKQVDRSKK